MANVEEVTNVQEVTESSEAAVSASQETAAKPQYQGQRRFSRERGERREGQGDGEKKFERKPRRERERPEKEQDDLIKKTVSVNRVTKVVKGGRIMRFAALVVVGDGKGKVGYGLGKAGEVPQAIEKAQQAAKNRMIDVAIVGTTIPHETIGKYGRGYVILLPATSGTGVIAAGAVRSVLEAAGIKDIATKAYGTTNPINCVKATVEGLRSLKTIEQVAALRGKTVEELRD